MYPRDVKNRADMRGTNPIGGGVTLKDDPPIGSQPFGQCDIVKGAGRRRLPWKAVITGLLNVYSAGGRHDRF